MSSNSFGNHFVVHSFGESHGSALGVVIDGCPAGVDFDFDFLKQELERRRPGLWGTSSDGLVSARQESDFPEIMSGVFEGKTLGSPICILVRNQDHNSSSYDFIKNNPRKGHVDDLWRTKFHHVDHRGGGRSSGRETVARVMAGAVAKMLLKKTCPNLKITGYISQIGPHIFHFPSNNEQQIRELLLNAQQKGESYGGVVNLLIQQVPVGLGQPVFHKLKADLATACMSVGATTGFEIGAGFSSAKEKGTDFHQGDSSVYGGIRGGISTGEDISIKIAIKPTSSILDTAKKGRHDPCIAIRSIPVFEAMAAIVLADHWLWQKMDRI